MSVPVDVETLAARLEEFGPGAFLITAASGGRPHVVSITATFVDGELVCTAGATSRANLISSETATLLWPGRPSDDYALIVDGTPQALDAEDPVRVRPTRAVLHRLAVAPEDLPTCIRIESAEPG